MTRDYTPDRWRDRSIIAQSSAKVAADVLTAFGTPDGVEVGQWLFDTYPLVHKMVFDSTMSLVGEEPVPTVEPSASQTYSESSEAGGPPYANMPVQFGKFKGMTLSEIDAAFGDDGKSGRSWLEWAADNVSQGDYKQKIRAYLAATR